MLKSTIKLGVGLLFTSAFATQAFAEDLALAGTYGNYIKQGCYWASQGKSYYPMNTGSGSVGQVIVEPIALRCTPNPADAKAYTVYVTYDYNPNYGTDSTTCSLSGSSTTTAVGNCTNYKISQP